MRVIHRGFYINDVEWSGIDRGPSSTLCPICGSDFSSSYQEHLYDVEYISRRVVDLSVAYCSELCARDAINNRHLSASEDGMQEEATED
jgi:hypothetical protein